MSIQINSSQDRSQKIDIIKKFFRKYQEQIILIIGGILIATLAFFAGRISTVYKPISKEKLLKGEVKVPIKKEIQSKVNKNRKQEESELENSSDNIDNNENIMGDKEINNNEEVSNNNDEDIQNEEE